MNVSGILVVTPVEWLDETVAALNDLPGVESHHIDRSTGRIVVTQEAASVHEEVDGLKRIKALPHIILAEMVQHHFEDDREMFDNLPDELQNAEGLPGIPEFIKES